MTIPTTLTWDLASGDGGPARPSLEAMGEAALVDDADFAPVSPTMPTSAMLNQWQEQLAPSVYKFSAPSGNLVLGSLTITDNGDGDTTVAWPTNMLPVSVAEPMGTINGTSSGMISVETVSALSVRVRTWNASGVAADRAFTVHVF